MKIKQKIKSIPLSTEPQPIRIKRGTVHLELRNVKTGEVEVVEEHNMQTNAINEMLRNCGWLNRDNLSQSDLVRQLLGGAFMFNDTIEEDEDIVKSPADLYMIANASVNNTSIDPNEPTELGLFNSDESILSGNTWIFVYDWGTSKGNCPAGMQISSVCATNAQHGYAGEGNGSGLVKSATSHSLVGTTTEYHIPEIPCKLSLADSTIYGIDFSDLANGNITIRKYRLPVKKVNLLCTTSDLYLLSETTIQAPASLVSQGVAWDSNTSSTKPCVQYGTVTDNGEKLTIFSVNTNASNLWGNGYTQYLWEIDPVAETCTETVLLNTSGADLHAICFPIWLDPNTLAWVDGNDGYVYAQTYNRRDGRVIYSMRRTNGTWSAIQSCSNPIGADNGSDSCGWRNAIQTGDGKAFVHSGSWDIMFDYEANVAYRMNANDASYNAMFPTDAPLVRYSSSLYASKYSIAVKRTQCCIATIFNLGSPVQKTPDKTMKLRYTFEFDEQEENAIGEIGGGVS